MQRSFKFACVLWVACWHLVLWSVLQERNKLFYSDVGSNFIVIITQYLSMYFFYLLGHPGECKNLRFWGLNFLHPIIYNGSDLRCSTVVLLYPLDNSINFDSSDPSGYLIYSWKHYSNVGITQARGIYAKFQEMYSKTKNDNNSIVVPL